MLKLYLRKGKQRINIGQLLLGIHSVSLPAEGENLTKFSLMLYLLYKKCEDFGISIVMKDTVSQKKIVLWNLFGISRTTSLVKVLIKVL